MNNLPGFRGKNEEELQTILSKIFIFPLIWIPGMAFWAMDQYEKGLAILILTIIPLLYGFTYFNHWISNILIPLGIFIYLWYLVDGFYTWRERYYPVLPSMIPRLKGFGFILLGILLISLLWFPDINLIRIEKSYYQPEIESGDYLFVNLRPRFTRAYSRGDLVMIVYSQQTTIGRLLGFPNELIYLRNENFFAQGKQLDSGFLNMNSNGPNRRIDIPENHYFVLLNIRGINLTNYSHTEILPAYAILGRIEGIISPSSHRKRLI